MGRPEDIFERIGEEREAAIDYFIINCQYEELFLDFKRSADDGKGVKLHEDDRKNFGKAVSGFGNSEGGVIVWGIDCRPNEALGDVAQAKRPITNPNRFASWLESTVSGCTVPSHPFVRNEVIEIGKEGTGYVVTYIAKSSFAPHQSLRPYPQYYIRAGSDFVPAPHAVLAGMFGRRPQPYVFNMWTCYPLQETRVDGKRALTVKVGLQLASSGPGIARNLYVSMDLLPPKGGSKGFLQVSDENNWEGNFAYGRICQLVSKDSFKLAPQQFCEPLRITLILVEPFESDLFYKISFGEERSPIRFLENTVHKDKIHAGFLACLQSSTGPNTSFHAAELSMMLGIEESENRPGDDYYETGI